MLVLKDEVVYKNTGLDKKAIEEKLQYITRNRETFISRPSKFND